MTATRQRLPVLAPADWFLLLFGAFLGLALIKFGNPIVLDAHVERPRGLSDLWSFPWPPRWGLWLLLPLALAGLFVGLSKGGWQSARALWLLPAGWLVWQLLASTQSVDSGLTRITLLHLAGCVACYLIGAIAVRGTWELKLVFAVLIMAYVFCLMRAVDQRLFEFPQERQFLVESERVGWTNMPPELFYDLKRQGVIVSTNGVDIANPVYLDKYSRARVHGTLVYPNALAGAILLLFPPALVLAINGTRKFRPVTGWFAIGLLLFLSLASLYWTGSKSGWLIALAMGGAWLFTFNWSKKLKILAVCAVFLVGLTLFAVRFQNYFAAGATSLGARFDYWRAAVQVTADRPIFGSGPGTFQRPYEEIKRPEAEMARLVHNDYLEQFSDSGVVGGCLYLAWIAVLSMTLMRCIWRRPPRDLLLMATAFGVLGWLVQGLSEFSLYVPGLSWTAFCLAGGLVGFCRNGIDKTPTAR